MPGTETELNSPAVLQGRAETLLDEARALIAGEDIEAVPDEKIREANDKIAKARGLKTRAAALLAVNSEDPALVTEIGGGDSSLNRDAGDAALAAHERRGGLMSPAQIGAIENWVRTGSLGERPPEGVYVGRDFIDIGFGLGDSYRNMQLAERLKIRNVVDFSDSATLASDVQPKVVVPRVARAMRMFNSVYEVADMVPTESGNPLVYPTVDPRATKGVRLTSAQLTMEDLGNATLPVGRDSQTHIPFAGVMLYAHTYSSQATRLTEDVMQDTSFDIEGIITSIQGESLGRITADDFTGGAGGANEPQGITVAGGNRTPQFKRTLAGLNYDALVDMRSAVDRAYRQRATWMMNSETEGTIMKLKDSMNRPIWTGGFTEDAPDRILGRPVVINDVMDGHAAGTSEDAVTILFGYLGQYKVRQVRGLRMYRLNETFRTANQIGFIAFVRMDARLVDPSDAAGDGTRAIVRMTFDAP